MYSNNTASTAAIKCVKQSYIPNDEILSMLEAQRCMVNDCIRIGLEENMTSIKSLSLKAYPRLREYDGIPSYYRLTAISRAAGILKNYRKVVAKEKPWARIPYVRKPSLTDCYGFKIFGMLLRLTFRAGQYLFIILNNHTLKTISQFKVKSVTLTPTSLSVAYSREVKRIEPKGFIGIDTNMGNVTIATTGGKITRLDLGDPMRIKEVYREIKSHFKRNDRRIRKKIYSKYGKSERDRVKSKIHQATKRIIEFAKENQLAIFMEDLKGIRKMGRRGNFQGRRRRFRLNSWSDHEYQSQQEYKARWEGIQVFYVNPWGTSSECSICGTKVITDKVLNEHRLVYCPKCYRYMDRDENAARNILKKGLLRFGSDGPPGEAMKRNPDGRRRQAIRGADGIGKIISAPGER